MPEKWSKPHFKGLTLLGSWRESEASITAMQRGSVPIEEHELCAELHREPDQVEDWLARNWTEHDIHAVMDGREDCRPLTLSLIREHGGPCVHFQVRLFSPNSPDVWPEKFKPRILEVM